MSSINSRTQHPVFSKQETQDLHTKSSTNKKPALVTSPTYHTSKAFESSLLRLPHPKVCHRADTDNMHCRCGGNVSRKHELQTRIGNKGEILFSVDG